MMKGAAKVNRKGENVGSGGNRGGAGANADPRQWRCWDDVPLVLKTGQVVDLFGLDRRTLDKLAGEGLLRRGLVAGAYRYGKAGLRHFAREAGCDPFLI